MPVNYVLLAVLSGIIGLVITGFTAWHLWLTVRGQTTIESLEKTRYLSPLRNTMKHNLQDRNYLNAQANGRLSIGDQLREIHANALPGVTRPEEGIPSHTPAPSGAPMSNGYSHPTYSSYEDRERQQTQDRYDSYLDERDNEQLPNAFDLGWKRNVTHVFGPSPLKWFVPICTTTGDGWSWEPSPKWLAVRDRIKTDREREEEVQKQRERAAGWGVDSPTEADFRRNGSANGWQAGAPQRMPSPRQPRRPEWQQVKHGEPTRYLTTSNGIVRSPSEGRRSPSKADQVLGREHGMYADGDVQLQNIDRRKFDQYNYISEDEDDDYEVSSDEQAADQRKTQHSQKLVKPLPTAAASSSHQQQQSKTSNWNDIPEGFLDPAPKHKKSPSQERKTSSATTKNGEWDDWGT